MHFNEIPDHPEIACALETGYPNPPEELQGIYCNDCGQEMTGIDEVYDYDEVQLCSNCFLVRVANEDFYAAAIAGALGVPHKPAYNCIGGGCHD